MKKCLFFTQLDDFNSIKMSQIETMRTSILNFQKKIFELSNEIMIDELLKNVINFKRFYVSEHQFRRPIISIHLSYRFFVIVTSVKYKQGRPERGFRGSL